MVWINPHSYIGGSRRTGSRGGYRHQPETNGDGDGLKPSEIIAVSHEPLDLIAEYRRDERKEADDDQTGLREAE